MAAKKKPAAGKKPPFMADPKAAKTAGKKEMPAKKTSGRGARGAKGRGR